MLLSCRGTPLPLLCYCMFVLVRPWFNVNVSLAGTLDIMVVVVLVVEEGTVWKLRKFTFSKHLQKLREINGLYCDVFTKFSFQARVISRFSSQWKTNNTKLWSSSCAWWLSSTLLRLCCFFAVLQLIVECLHFAKRWHINLQTLFRIFQLYVVVNQMYVCISRDDISFLSLTYVGFKWYLTTIVW